MWKDFTYNSFMSCSLLNSFRWSGPQNQHWLLNLKYYQSNKWGGWNRHKNTRCSKEFLIINVSKIAMSKILKMFLWIKISSLGSFVTQCAHSSLGQKGACIIQCQITFNSLAVSRYIIEYFRLIILCHRNLWTLNVNKELKDYMINSVKISKSMFSVIIIHCVQLQTETVRFSQF